MDDNERKLLNKLYNERSELAIFHATLMWKEITFFSTIILATITIPIALLRIQPNTYKEVLVVFPILGLLFSIAGFWALYRESKGFYSALYSISLIREILSGDIKDFFTKVNVNSKYSLSKKYNLIGIYHIDFDLYPNLCEYLKANIIRLKSIRTVLYLFYILFGGINIILIPYYVYV